MTVARCDITHCEVRRVVPVMSFDCAPAFWGGESFKVCECMQVGRLAIVHFDEAALAARRMELAPHGWEVAVVRFRVQCARVHAHVFVI